MEVQELLLSNETTSTKGFETASAVNRPIGLYSQQARSVLKKACSCGELMKVAT